MTDAATQKFQSSFPVLFSATPQLAALHNSRIRQKCFENEVEAPVDSCFKCGAFLHGLDTEAESTTRLFRAGKQRKHARVIQSTCGNCGWSHRRVIEKGNASLFPRRKPARVRASSLPSRKPTIISSPVSRTENNNQSSSSTTIASKQLNLPIASPSPSPSISSKAHSLPTPPPQTARNRPKKKSGLQEMLARNREKEEKQKQSSSAQKGGQNAGLAAFLSGL
ncbi:hypothetical protein V5O48_007293 [Marasmius crinis-equi]|uniref:Uncharacterized protein n=1 Tax=Marasmius crinis-equi TaxID=585013 RepID=A0ABR3FH36_9AGAR